MIEPGMQEETIAPQEMLQRECISNLFSILLVIISTRHISQTLLTH